MVYFLAARPAGGVTPVSARLKPITFTTCRTSWQTIRLKSCATTGKSNAPRSPPPARVRNANGGSISGSDYGFMSNQPTNWWVADSASNGVLRRDDGYALRPPHRTNPDQSAGQAHRPPRRPLPRPLSGPRRGCHRAVRRDWAGCLSSGQRPVLSRGSRYGHQQPGGPGGRFHPADHVLRRRRRRLRVATVALWPVGGARASGATGGAEPAHAHVHQA